MSPRPTGRRDPGRIPGVFQDVGDIGQRPRRVGTTRILEDMKHRSEGVIARRNSRTAGLDVVVGKGIGHREALRFDLFFAFFFLGRANFTVSMSFFLRLATSRWRFWTAVIRES